jgi:hypothetical protein
MQRLWYHPESDSLFWSEEYPHEGLCEDMTHDLGFRLKAQDIITTPKDVEPYDHDEDVTFGDSKIGDLRIFMAFNGKVTPETAVYSGRQTREPKLPSKPTMASGTIAAAIVESYKKWERKPADLYPTPVDGTESLIPLLQSIALLSDGTVDKTGTEGRSIQRIWEPACGDGRISRVLEWHGYDVFSSDLREHSGYGRGGFNFLTDHLSEIGWDPKDDIDAIVTNPPFSHAKEFITKALTIAPVVVMLVKQTYWNTKGRLSLWDEFRPAFFLPFTWRLAFLKDERGNSPLMDCAWCVWIRGNDEPGCFMEPLRRRVYPGYHGKGLVGANANLTEAVIELGTAVAEFRSRIMASREDGGDDEEKAI